MDFLYSITLSVRVSLCVCVCVFNSYDHPLEIPDYYTERAFMKDHPWLGVYHNFIITGIPIAPPQDKPEEIQVVRYSSYN